MKLLTIIIPTYNRKEYIDDSLCHLYKLMNKFEFDIVVCDNGSTDGTCEAVDNWGKKISNLKIIHHTHNKGYDYNVASGYRMSETKYCWLLGDSYRIDENILTVIFKNLKMNDYDAIIINTQKNINEADKKYTNVNELIEELGWKITNLTASIIKTEYASNYTINRSGNTYFLHFGVLFEGLAMKEKINVLYIPSISAYGVRLSVEKNKLSGGWRKTPFTVFGLQWTEIVMSLPNTISIQSKLKCIMSHDQHKNIFEPNHLFFNKLCGLISKDDYRNARHVIPLVTRHPQLLLDCIFLIPILPKCFVKWLMKLNNYRLSKKGL